MSTIFLIILLAFTLFDMLSLRLHQQYSAKLNGVLEWMTERFIAISDIENAETLVNRMDYNFRLIHQWATETQKYIIPGILFTEGFAATIFVFAAFADNYIPGVVTLNVMAIAQAGVISMVVLMFNRMFKAMQITRTINGEVAALELENKKEDDNPDV